MALTRLESIAGSDGAKYCRPIFGSGEFSGVKAQWLILWSTSTSRSELAYSRPEISRDDSRYLSGTTVMRQNIFQDFHTTILLLPSCQLRSGVHPVMTNENGLELEGCSY